MANRSLGLQELPVELLYEVQLHALSEHLPLTSKFLRAVYANTSITFRAEYLLRRTLRGPQSQPPPDLFTKALRYPICSVEVLDALSRLVHRPQPLFTEDEPVPSELPPPPHDLRFEPPDLPRRLFRQLAPKARSWERWRPNDEPLPFLRRLFESPPVGMRAPNANAHEGYALTKAVHVGFLPLVEMLLAHGASPRAKDGLAVMVAIRRQDLPLVKMLLERGSGAGEGSSSGSAGGAGGAERKHKGRAGGGGANSRQGGEPARGAKRRRLEDRMEPSPAMLKVAVKCGARDIADYLMNEKGCVPDMQTLKLMTR
ncbi:hypothetical protein HGRIS_003737 [Hohenbuehelia grisea]|uniref:Ankyrin repeat domain-containing protein n=1 Tax=Hohenbuehelia grisea TaxID=104357 RepID=A0ABR3JHF9_9AGAR